MTVHLTLVSQNEKVLNLVGDFARGLGSTAVAAPSPLGHSLRTELPDAGETLLELLSYVALSATRAGIDPAEPFCRVTYWHRGAAAEVTLGLRVAEFLLEKGGSTVA